MLLFGETSSPLFPLAKDRIEDAARRCNVLRHERRDVTGRVKAKMAECSYARCVQERRAIKKELQRWTKNMVFVVGECPKCSSNTTEIALLHSEAVCCQIFATCCQKMPKTIRQGVRISVSRDTPLHRAMFPVASSSRCGVVINLCVRRCRQARSAVVCKRVLCKL